MSADAPNPNAPQPCPICSEARALSEHLIELGLAANYLGNKSTYTSEHGTATIKTETIGNWLQHRNRCDALLPVDNIRNLG